MKKNKKDKKDKEPTDYELIRTSEAEYNKYMYRCIKRTNKLSKKAIHNIKITCGLLLILEGSLVLLILWAR